MAARTTDVASRARTHVAALALAALAVFGGACGDEATAHEFTLAVAADDAWRGPALPEFALTERSGRAVKLADLAGQPFVLDFVFTTCTGPCPAMTAHMRELQDELAKSRARLVSFSVDPPRDTPQVLAKYADGFGADRERWWFLTGDEAQIAKIAAAISLPMQRDPDAKGATGMQVAHATRFVVVDARGVVRGMYDGLTSEGVQAAAARARWLEAHPER
jgi:cytochrome oxidase Cu insertion factor (SCO1/SenC/PrrC family)